MCSQTEKARESDEALQNHAWENTPEKNIWIRLWLPPEEGSLKRERLLEITINLSCLKVTNHASVSMPRMRPWNIQPSEWLKDIPDLYSLSSFPESTGRKICLNEWREPGGHPAIYIRVHSALSFYVLMDGRMRQTARQSSASPALSPRSYLLLLLNYILEREVHTHFLVLKRDNTNYAPIYS